MSVSCECCLLSGRGLCFELITRPEESYRVWCCLSVIVKPRQCGGPGPQGAVAPLKKKAEPLCEVRLKSLHFIFNIPK
jgi:hypothetical protein